jgi:hypothetical protein
MTRREMLRDAAVGFGGLALSSMQAAEVFDLAPRKPHFPAKAKNVIFIYIGGGPSTIDMWDPKAVLSRFDGKPAPFEIKGRALNGSQQIMASRWPYTKCGETGREISNLLPHFQKVVDKVTFVRSMQTDRIDHSTAQFTFVTGRGFTGFPSLGAWVSYALGSENRNLPAFVALGDGATIGTRAHSSAWLPPVFSGTSMRADPQSPIFDIKRPAGMTEDRQSRLLAMVKQLNREQKAEYPLDQDLESRIANYELAARMQIEATDALDLDKESEATKEAYGMNEERTASYGKRCLMARRLIERGVRLVQIYIEGQIWDNHSKIRDGLDYACGKTDKPAAALVRDLKERGLLDSTLVVWGGEFGRLPIAQDPGPNAGRDHGPSGFSIWMAGGGVKAGTTYGATDDIGYRAAVDKVSVHDFHATVLHLLGMNHRDLVFEREGRQERITDEFPARVIDGILT